MLQEIKALGAWNKAPTNEPPQRKSKRKQGHVRHIAQVQVKKEIESDDDSVDEDYIPDDFDEDEEYSPEKDIITVTLKGTKGQRSARGRRTKKAPSRQLYVPEGDGDGEEGTSSKV